MIGVVATSYPRHDDDHAGSFVAVRVHQLRQQGHDVQVIAAGTPPGDPHIRRVPFEVVGAKIPLFYGPGAPEALADLGSWLQAIRFSAGLTAAFLSESRRCASFETHWLLPCALIVATVAPHRPHRAFAHSGDVALLERLPGGLGRTLVGGLIRAGVQITAVSDDLGRRLGDLGASQVTVQAAPVDDLLFSPAHQPSRGQARRLLGLDPDAVLVLGVGRLVPIKGFDLLVRAVGRLPLARRPRVVLLGNGPERTALHALATARGVGLDLRGFVARRQVPIWMTAADLVVAPSRRLPDGRTEGAPVAAREALRLNRPLVLTTTGGLSDLVGRAGVTAVAPDDVAALSRALLAALP